MCLLERFTMYSRVNFKSKRTPKDKNFFIGRVKGEVGKVKAFWNRVIVKPDFSSNQMNTSLVRRVCAPIPINQAEVAAESRGEKPERSYFNSIYMVKII